MACQALQLPSEPSSSWRCANSIITSVISFSQQPYEELSLADEETEAWRDDSPSQGHRVRAGEVGSEPDLLLHSVLV